MKITLSKTEIETLLAAISSAIQNEESLIDAHHTEFPTNIIGPKVVPEECKPIVSRTRAFIGKMRKLQVKLFEARNGHAKEKVSA